VPLPRKHVSKTPAPYKPDALELIPAVQICPENTGMKSMKGLIENYGKNRRR
jgi:hypothetical protein